MFSDNDYTKFKTYWKAYMEMHGEALDDDTCRDKFDKVKHYAPCTITEFCTQIERSMATCPKKLSMPELFELAKYNGRTKDEAKSYALKLWRVFLDNNDPFTDVIFSDNRACIAFYVCFGDVNSYSDIPLKLRNDNFDGKKFAENYVSCIVDDNQDVLQKYTVMRRRFSASCEIVRVTVIGELQKGLAIANAFYGQDHYVLIEKGHLLSKEENPALLKHATKALRGKEDEN